MDLDRNIDGTGRGKYGLVNHRKLLAMPAGSGAGAVKAAVKVLEHFGIIEWGEAGSEHEFFVVKLKDKYADDALHRYAISANADGELDYARAVDELADRAGPNHPFCKKPD